MNKLEKKLEELGYEKLMEYTDFITRNFFQSFYKCNNKILFIISFQDGKIFNYDPKNNLEMQKDLEILKESEE